MPHVKLGEFIKQARKERALSLRAVARTTQVDPAHLCRIEAGKVTPSASLLVKLSGVLGANVDQLMLLSGRVPDGLRAAVEAKPGDGVAVLRDASVTVRESQGRYQTALLVQGESRAIEDGFPFEEISEIAEMESWRKEVYRPVYHVHKWWAQRLGSVFRAAILAAATPRGLSIMDLFYQPVQLPELVIFDPFMGSGTIPGEAHKLGCASIGRDINPVAYFAVRTALGSIGRSDLEEAFRIVRETAEEDVHALYREYDAKGRMREVLYYFWVKRLPCPTCGTQVDLFSTYVFARHTYPKKHPGAYAVCARCGGVQQVRYDCTRMECHACGYVFDPSQGPARRATAICHACDEEFDMAKTARALGQPPEHRMYAKLVLTSAGRKEYLRTTERDTEAYRQAEVRLASIPDAFPVVEIADGYNTRQVINYGYRYWHQMFNARQLLGFAILSRAIKSLHSGEARNALLCLLSGTLEFNNMFASYKGEGTGAVRHMFSHHILKPERMPIEANIWGTTKSSGAFSTLYRSRLLQALKYREAPFEVRVDNSGARKSGRKVYGLSPPIGGPILDGYPAEGLRPRSLYISCGDSSATDIPSQSVDLVVTDPPFFDNVHYSELADFFHVWLRHWLGSPGLEATTRRPEEVQSADALAFAGNLRNVFRECHRVLKDEGLLVFSYHHSREDGFSALAEAVLGADFAFVQAQPVKSEMSVAAPKSQAREPIDIDVLLVCRKRHHDSRPQRAPEAALDVACKIVGDRLVRFNSRGRILSNSDVRVALLSQLLVEITPGRTVEQVRQVFDDVCDRARARAASIQPGQAEVVSRSPNRRGQGLLFPQSV